MRTNWVRMRTLIVLRWIAVAGQLAAISVAQRAFNVELELGLAFLAIGGAIIANLIAVFIYPENKRLSETEAASMHVFDLLQLGFLLMVTGGLHNPFALLILAPVTISATTLSARTTIGLGVLAIAMISLMSQWYVPLKTVSGEILQLPDLFAFGFWTAIVIGVIFNAAYAQRVSAEVHAMSDALTATQMALAREQKLTDLGGVVAAAAHELGTPLATIMLVSQELKDDLRDSPQLAEDADLIREQAGRCRDILKSMGRAGKDDLHLRNAPISAIVEEAAEPHANRGKKILFDVSPEGGADQSQPVIERRPEIIHGLRNLIQNAVDFAKDTVWIDIHWTEKSIRVRIVDDGPGFPAHILNRIGDPFVRSRKSASLRTERPQYEGMGLGLFIAKTLLERSGADLTFANGREPFEEPPGAGIPAGAVVECRWPRPEMPGDLRTDRKALGANITIEA